MKSKRTARKKRTTRPSRDEDFFTRLFRAHPIPTWIHDAKSLAVLEVNDATVRQYGYSRREFLKLTVESLGMSAEEARRYAGPGKVAPIGCSTSHRRKDGRILSVRCTTRPTMHRGRKAVLVAAEVIAEGSADSAPSSRTVGVESGSSQVLDRISDGVVALDRDWIYTYVNSQAGKLLGRAPAQLVGKHIGTEFPDGLGQKFNLAYERAMATGEPIFLEEYYPPFKRWFENRIYPSADGLTIYFRDVTARKQAEVALRDGEERLRLALGAANQGLYDLNVQTGEVNVSPEYAEMLGYDPAEFQESNSTWLERLHPDDRERTAAVYRDYIAGRLQEYRVEFRLQTRTGGWLWILSVGSVVERTADGRPLRMLGTHTDITALKESQVALAQFKRTLDQTRDSVFIFRPDDLRFIYVNEGARQQVGYNESEMLGMTPLDVKPEFMEAEFRALLAPLESGARTHVYLQTPHRHKDSHLIPVEVVIQLVQGPGITPRFVAIVRDVTERREAEEALRRSEENLAITLQSIGDAVIATDADSRIIRMNPTAERLTGWTLGEAAGQPLSTVFRVVNARTRHLIVDPGQVALERGETVGVTNHTVLVARDGREFQIADSAAPIRDSSGRVAGVVLVFSDVSAQYRIQQALGESERHLRTIIDTEPECVKVVGTDGRLEQMNAAGLAMLEAESFEEVRAKGLEEFILSEYRSAFRDLHRRVLHGERAVLEFEIIGLKGTRRWLETHAAPLVVEEGQGTKLLGVTRDVTARKQAEAAHERMEAQLRQAEKMEAVGRLAGGVAHDFNNLLTVINSTADLALEQLGGTGSVSEDLTEIRRAGERAAELTGQLLAFSRTQIVSPEVLDANAVLAEMRPLLVRVVRENIALEIQPAEDLKPVNADRSQLERVIMNLALNARDAMPEAGSLVIETRNAHYDQPPATITPPLSPGGYVALSFRDTGEGMDAETRERVFEPFFTTKEFGRGTGLGLSSVYGIVATFGGGVSVESEPGRGSTFCVYLPWAASAAPTSEGPAVAAPHAGTETILVVDDEEALVRVAVRLLQQAGYTTLHASSAAEALGVLERHPGPIDLLMTDVVMPGMSGPDLADRAVALRPNLKVLYTSGYSDNAILRHAIHDRTARFLEKPYTKEILRRQVRDTLGGPPVTP